jgi:hypothetical protein
MSLGELYEELERIEAEIVSVLIEDGALELSEAITVEASASAAIAIAVAGGNRDREPLADRVPEPFVDTDREPLADRDRKPLAGTDREPLADRDGEPLAARTDGNHFAGAGSVTQERSWR